MRMLVDELESALDRNESTAVICKKLRSAGAGKGEIISSMLNAWRMFSVDFYERCSRHDRMFLLKLADEVPEIVARNFRKQVRGMELKLAKRMASFGHGRGNVSIDDPCPDGARHEVHDVFVPGRSVAEYAQGLSGYPNLGANDIATTIWAGRIYQEDFFREASQQLKLKMLEHLHAVAPEIAQPFVAQVLRARDLPIRYRTLAWTEGVLRTNPPCDSSDEIAKGAESEVAEWVFNNSKEDKVARFDIERNLRGYQLSRTVVNQLIRNSAINILSYYIASCMDELVPLYPLGDLAASLCDRLEYPKLLPLLESIEGLSPGTMGSYRDANGANLLEHLLYRFRGKTPDRGGWAYACLRRRRSFTDVLKFLRKVGCRDDVANNVGISWKDVEDAAEVRFDGTLH